MKKDNVLVKAMLLVALFGVVAVASSVSSYPPQSVTVGTSSTLIAPSIVSAVASNHGTSVTYTVGQYISVWSNGTSTTRFAQPLEYWCITAGDSATTNIANWGQTNDVTDGTAVWRPINQNRKGITVINDSTSTVYVAFGAPAVLNKGIRLNANGGSVSRDGWKGEVYAIAGATNLNVCVQEE